MLKTNKFINILQSKRMLIKLLLSSLGIAIFSILISTSIFTYWIKAEGVSAINSATELSLSNISTLTSNIFESSKRIAYDVYNNVNVRNIFLFNDKDKLDKVYAAEYIKNITVSNPAVFSVTVCNKSSVILQISQKPRFEEDYAAIEPLIKTRKLLQPIPRIIKGEDGEDIYLYTMVYHGFPGGDSDIDSVVIVNLDVKNLYEQVYPTYLNKKQDIVLVDMNGSILLHNTYDMFSKNISGESYYKTAIQSSKDWGSFNVIKDNVNYVYSYLFGNDRRYLVLFISDYNTFFSRVSQVQKVSILIGIGLLLVISTLYVFLSYKLYTPINNIFFNIKSLFRNSPYDDNQLTKVKFMSQSINNLVMKLNNMEEETINSFKITRTNFMRDIFTYNNQFSEGDLVEEYKKYKVLEYITGDYYIIVLRIDCFKTFCNNTKEAIDFQLDSIGNMACESFQPDFNCTFSQIDEGHIVVIAKVLSTKSISYVESQLIDLVEKYQELVQQLFGLGLTVGISSVSNNIKGIRDKYKEAFNLTNYRLIYGRGSILTSNKLILENFKSEKLMSLMDSIIKAVKSDSIEVYKKDLFTLFKTLEHSNYEKIVKVFYQLENFILHIPIELQANNINNFDYELEDAYKIIKNFESFMDLEEYFIELFVRTKNSICSIKNQKIPDLMENVIKYINDNYSEKDLSSNMVADKISITPQYFSKIFNEVTGVSFPDYVNNVRLEKAKELLCNNLKINIAEVCEKVGYNNRTYFTSSFTKKYGISPAKFKNQYCLDKLTES